MSIDRLELLAQEGHRTIKAMHEDFTAERDGGVIPESPVFTIPEYVKPPARDRLKGLGAIAGGALALAGTAVVSVLAYEHFTDEAEQVFEKQKAQYEVCIGDIPNPYPEGLRLQAEADCVAEQVGP